MKKIFSILPDFLRDPDSFFNEIQKNKRVHEKALLLALSSLFSLIVYGFTVGLSHSLAQALSAALKMPLLFLSTMLFCLPALYFFSLALLGTPLKMIQVLTVVLGGISVTSFLLLGLAPITLFFVLTSNNYAFFQLMAVCFVGLSGWIGVYFLWRGMTRVETARNDRLKQLGNRILFLWILLYGFIGTQMTWRLSPFIGDPTEPFVFIQPSRDNFYVDVVRALQHALALQSPNLDWLTSFGIVLFCIVAFVAFLFVGGMFLAYSFRKPLPVEKPLTPTAG
jgi:hypothetical protein